MVKYVSIYVKRNEAYAIHLLQFFVQLTYDTSIPSTNTRK